MKPNPLTQTVFFLMVTLLISSCATILGKSTYPVAIRTDPKGVTISITNKKGKEVYKGVSPATVMLKSGAGYFSKASYEVKLFAPGYGEQVITFSSKLNGWYFGNIIIGGLLGLLIVDPLTGAMWKLNAPIIDATLIKSTAESTMPELKIINIQDVPESIRSSLVKIK